MTQFNIEIVSDTVCPWCYVGRKKLNKAIDEYQLKHPASKDTFTITWKPYFLNPAASKIGMSSLQQRPFTPRFLQPIQSTDTG